MESGVGKTRSQDLPRNSGASRRLQALSFLFWCALQGKFSWIARFNSGRWRELSLPCGKQGEGKFYRLPLAERQTGYAGINFDCVSRKLEFMYFWWEGDGRMGIAYICAGSGVDFGGNLFSGTIVLYTQTANWDSLESITMWMFTRSGQVTTVCMFIQVKLQSFYAGMEMAKFTIVQLFPVSRSGYNLQSCKRFTHSLRQQPAFCRLRLFMHAALLSEWAVT